jgi:hypothetical protein
MDSFRKNDFIAISRFVFNAYLIGITGKSFSRHSVFGPLKMKDGTVNSLELQDVIMNRVTTASGRFRPIRRILARIENVSAQGLRLRRPRALVIYWVENTKSFAILKINKCPCFGQTACLRRKKQVLDDPFLSKVNLNRYPSPLHQISLIRHAVASGLRESSVLSSYSRKITRC